MARRVLDLLLRRLESRFEHAGAYDGGRLDHPQRDMLELCRRGRRDEDFAAIPPSEVPRPNNVLVGDWGYSRVWRAWMLLHREEEVLAAAWPLVEERFRTALFWAIAGELAARPGAHVAEDLVVPEPDKSGPGEQVVADSPGAELMSSSC